LKKDLDAETRKLMGEKSVAETLLSYLVALLYAAMAAVAAMAGREMIEAVARKMVSGMELEVNQYSGIMRISTIGGLALMVILWLGTFLIVWHRVERADSMRGRLLAGARWIVGAVVLYLIFAVTQLAVAGYWPLLSGAA
jgi:hypothetical protein